MSGRVILITGATSGIGAETGRYLAKEGWKIIITGRREAEGNKVVEQITSAGGEATFIRADVAESEEAVASLVEKAAATYGRLDAAFNNAGCHTDSTLFEDLRTEAFESMVKLNLMGTFWCMKHQLKLFRAQGKGAIVNCASIAGLHGVPFNGTYVATKHGMIGMTRCAAAEYANKGVTVNAVAPGAIRTEILETIFADDGNSWSEEQTVSMFPIKQLGESVDIARGVSFLVNSPYVTGTVLEIEGGFAVRNSHLG